MLIHQLKAATLGFGVTVTPIVIVAATQNIFMPQIVTVLQGVDSNDQAWVVSSLRREWLGVHTTAATIIAVYWLLTVVLGRGQLLRLKAANLTLAFCIVAYLTMTFYYIFVQWPDGLKVVCPFLGISDTDAPRFVFDAQSSCGAFAYAVHQSIVLGTLGLIVPLTISLIIRIVSSRRTKLAKV